MLCLWLQGSEYAYTICRIRVISTKNSFQCLDYNDLYSMEIISSPKTYISELLKLKINYAFNSSVHQQNRWNEFCRGNNAFAAIYMHSRSKGSVSVRWHGLIVMIGIKLFSHAKLNGALRSTYSHKPSVLLWICPYVIEAVHRRIYNDNKRRLSAAYANCTNNCWQNVPGRFCLALQAACQTFPTNIS